MIQSVEILALTQQNLDAHLEEQLQENEALEYDAPEEIPGTAEAKAVDAAEDETIPTQADAAPASAYEPEEWDEFKSRRHDGEYCDTKYEALQNSPGRADTAQDILANQLGLVDAPERANALAKILVYNLNDDGYLPPHRLVTPLLDALDENDNLGKPLVDVVADTLGIAAVKVPESKRGVTPEQIVAAIDAREQVILEAQDVLARILRIRALADGARLTNREVTLRYPLVDVLDRERGDWTIDEAEEALRLVQRLEPRGIGGRTLEETIVLQLEPEGLTYRELRELVENHLDDLAKHRLAKIAKDMKCDVDDVKLLVEELRDMKVKFKPGARLAEESARPVHPDVVITEENGDFKVEFVNSHFPSLAIRADYVQIIHDKMLPTPLREHARKKVEEARWLIDAIHQRQATLSKVVRCLFTHQRDFLVHGKTALRPLKMQSVADELSIDDSTVSRAVADKWVQTPMGVHSLKSFFIGGIETASGEVESRDNVKERVREIFSSETPTNPFSDADVAERLKREGREVARRTVRKYREQLGLPKSQDRRRAARFGRPPEAA